MATDPSDEPSPVEDQATEDVQDLLPLLYRPRPDLASRVRRAIDRERFRRVVLAAAAVLALIFGAISWSMATTRADHEPRSSTGVVAVAGTSLGEATVETRWSWGLTAAKFALAPGTVARAGAEPGLIDLTAGSITASVDHSRQRQALVIRTPHAVATVIGTVFTIRVDARTTRLTVESGSVRFSFADRNEVVSGPGMMETPAPIAVAPTSWTVRELSRWIITDRRLRELSALAVDPMHPDRLWGCGDHGNPASLFAIDPGTQRITEYPVARAVNHDWEDLAPMVMDGRPLVAIGDIGKSRKNQPARILLVEADPPLAVQQTLVINLPADVIDLDCLAWDAREQSFYLVGKDGDHPVLRCPFTTQETTTASVVGAVVARRPAALAIDTSAERMALLDEDGTITFFGRTGGVWDLARPRGSWVVSGIPIAQALAWSDAGTRLWVSGEGPTKPLCQLAVEAHQHGDF